MPRTIAIGRIFALILILGGCTIVRVDGPVRATMVGLGTLKIEPIGTGGIVYHSRGLGLVTGIGGATIGYRSETVALLPANDACRLILFEPRPSDAETLRTILTPVVGTTGICTTGGEKR